MKLRTNYGAQYKAFQVTSNNGEDVFRIMGDGKVWATEVNIRVKERFPDYVFEPTYKLMPINQLALYINKEGHLPNIPKASEIEETGMDLGEMNRLLLEKIEELTLYIIQQQEQLEAQNKKFDHLEQEINMLKKD